MGWLSHLLERCAQFEGAIIEPAVSVGFTRARILEPGRLKVAKHVFDALGQRSLALIVAPHRPGQRVQILDPPRIQQPAALIRR